MLKISNVSRLEAAKAQQRVDQFADAAEAAESQWLHQDAITALRTVSESIPHYGSGRRGLPELAERPERRASGELAANGTK